MRLKAAIALALMLTTTAAWARGLVTRTVIEGTVSSGGGAQVTPIGGATVTVYQAGHDKPLAAGSTNGEGRFNLSLTHDPKGGIFYAVARKGPEIELRTIIGENIIGTIVINEMTTVASAYALARILQNGAVPADPPLPARIAAGMAENLVSAATGMPSTLMRTSPNANETNAWRLLGTLANILADCVRNSGDACGTLFSLTTPPDGARPTTTCMWSGNFGWGGVFPTDGKGNPAGSVSKFSRGGQPLSPDAGFISNLYRVQGTVSDKQGNIWLASYGNDGVQIFPNGDPFTSYPLYQDANLSPFDIRLDDDGSGWVVYTGSSSVSKFTRTDNSLQRQFTVPVGADSQPKGLAVDSQGNAWVSAGADSAVYAFDKNGHPLGRFAGGGIARPWGAAVDSDDIVWAANFGELKPERRKYSVSALCGATISKCPFGLGFGDPISPQTGYTLPSGGDEVLLHNGKPLYDPLPMKSFQPLMRLTAAHPDAAGNLWVANNWKPDFTVDLLSNPGGDGMVVFVGLAAPVKPLLYSAPPVSPFDRN